MTNINYDPDAPAFGPGSQKAEDLKPKDGSSEDSQPKEPVEDTASSKKDDSSSGEDKDPVVVPEKEQKVPYSRFETVNREKSEAEKRAEEAEAQAAEWRRIAEEKGKTDPAKEEELPEEWKELLGDTPEARKVINLLDKRIGTLKDDAKKEALAEFNRLRQEDEKAQETNLSKIDDNLSQASKLLKRDLTEDEELSILSIQDEFTPKDKDGRYVGDLLPVEKAVEVYQLRVKAASEKDRSQRKVGSAASSARSEGEPNVKASDDKDFNPRDWNAYDRRLS